MTDIVERLRVAGKKYGMSVMREAADAIEARDAELARLRAELASIKALLRESTPYMDYRRCPSALINRIFGALGDDNEPVQKEQAED